MKAVVYQAAFSIAAENVPDPELQHPNDGSRASEVSRVEGSWAAGVSKFRENVRLSVQHKCHSVSLPWYQMMMWRDCPGFAASEDPRRPGIS